MPLYFKAFLLSLGCFILLTIAAVVKLGWQRLHRSNAYPPPEASARTALGDALLLILVATAWYSTAAGWICQLTVYPLYVDMSAFGAEPFRAYGHGYLSRLPAVILPAGVMSLTCGLMLWFPACGVSVAKSWLLAGLCVAFIAITPIAASAQGTMLQHGFSAEVHARLMWSNGVRTAIFSAMAVLSLAALRDRWRVGPVWPKHESASRDA